MVGGLAGTWLAGDGKNCRVLNLRIGHMPDILKTFKRF
jgi:hypothetical protein